jgi:L-rhamnose mutarotase
VRDSGLAAFPPDFCSGGSKTARALLACARQQKRPPVRQAREGSTMQRMGHVIGLKQEAIPEYKRLHAAVWPEVLATISRANIRNYSIFLKEPENVMFAYWEYHGVDFEADSALIAADPKTKEWWKICGPMQNPLETRKPGEWWARMEEVFHHD